MKLSQDEMIKVYACLALCLKENEKGLDSTLPYSDNDYEDELDSFDSIVFPKDDIVEFEKLVMKFYCEIKDEKILDRIDDIVEKGCNV